MFFHVKILVVYKVMYELSLEHLCGGKFGGWKVGRLEQLVLGHIGVYFWAAWIFLKIPAVGDIWKRKINERKHGINLYHSLLA